MTADISILDLFLQASLLVKTCDADIARHVNRVMGNDHQAQQSAFPSIKKMQSNLKTNSGQVQTFPNFTKK